MSARERDAPSSLFGGKVLHVAGEYLEVHRDRFYGGETVHVWRRESHRDARTDGWTMYFVGRMGSRYYGSEDLDGIWRIDYVSHPTGETRLLSAATREHLLEKIAHAFQQSIRARIDPKAGRGRFTGRPPSVSLKASCACCCARP